jgi:acyl-coenzyme A thioesterase PaaI-like protein
MRKVDTKVSRALVGAVAVFALCLPALGVQSTSAAAAPTSPKLSSRLAAVMRAPSLSAHSTLLGPVSRGSVIHGAIGLAPRDELALAKFIAAVTTRGSLVFHHYLRPGEFAARFGPSNQTIAMVKSELLGAGLQVGAVSSNRLLVSFHGTAGEVERAFHTGLAEVRLSDGTVGRATTSSVELPANLAPEVNVITGLDTTVTYRALGLLHQRDSKAGRAASVGSTAPTVAGAPTACVAATQDAAVNGGLTDDQIAKAYGAFGLYKHGDTGSGESIAIFELEPFARSDISTFDSCYFGKRAAAAMAKRLHVVAVDGGEPAGFGSGEAVLDVEDVSALAPGANIDVYEAPITTYGSIDDYNQIVAADADQVVSTSWGLCETALQQGEPGSLQEENAIFQQAAAQGQTVIAAAGDDGSDDCNSYYKLSPVAPVLSVDDPGSQPYVLSAGGTTIDDATQPPVEHVWNDGIKGGAGGGGISNTWVMPSWQADSLVPGIAAPSALLAAHQVEGDSFCAGNADGSTFGGAAGEPCREVPDVSAQASEFTGAITVYSASLSPGPTWNTVGGTSSSAPIWAAMLTLVNGSRTCANNKVGFAGGTNVPDVGFASPLLYAVASNPVTYAASFNDITSGNNDVYDVDNGAVFPATAGFDMASGLGSPQLTTPSGGNGLAYDLCTYGTAPSVPTVTGIVPDVLPTSSGGSVTVQGSKFEVAGVPDVHGVWINNYVVPPSDVVVTSATQLTLNNLPSGDELVPTDPANDGAGRAIVAVTLLDGATSPVTPASVLSIVDTTVGVTPKPAVTEVSAFGGAQAGGNQVKVFGSGFNAGVSSVTFGGVVAPTYDVVSPYEILVTVPAFAPLQTSCATALNASDDICQVQVVVVGANGSSGTYPITSAYEGPISFNDAGVVLPPSGCNCEVVPGPSEYDYLPPPKITSVSTSEGPSHYASEAGTSTVTITGVGLNDFGLADVQLGPVGQYSSIDSSVTYVSGTEIQLTAPSISQTVNPVRVPVTVETLAGRSNSSIATYSGVPIVASISPGAVPDTGAAHVAVEGNGFSDASVIHIVGTGDSVSVATVYKFHVATNQRTTFVDPSQTAAIADVEVCTTTACSTASAADELAIYAPGNPVVTDATPRSGPAHGGTLVTITGHNLGCATQVFFGSTSTASFHNVPVPYLGCGSTGAVVVRAPPGRSGTTVAITIETAESVATGFGPSKAVARATFTYAPSTPSAPIVARTAIGPDSVTVAWKAPLTDGGSPVTGYVLRAYAPGLPRRLVVLAGGARSYTFSGLYWGTRWTISLAARSVLGSGVRAIASARPRRPKSRAPSVIHATQRASRT